MTVKFEATLSEHEVMGVAMGAATVSFPLAVERPRPVR